MSDFLAEYLAPIDPEAKGPDPRSPTHRQFVSHLCRDGRVAELVEMIYECPYSFPSWNSAHLAERNLCFDGDANAREIHYARPALSVWATQLVGKQLYKEIGSLTVAEPGSPGDSFRVHIPATANARMREKGRVVVSPAEMMRFTMQSTIDRFRTRARLS